MFILLPVGISTSDKYMKLTSSPDGKKGKKKRKKKKKGQEEESDDDIPVSHEVSTVAEMPEVS